MTRFGLGAAAVVALLPLTLHAQRPLTMAARSTVYAPHGVVATSQPLASAAGLAVLQRGGNAIDAAVTAAAVLSVVEPMMTGVGGDMFAMVWIQKEHRLVALNASGRAGALMTRAELLRRGRSRMPAGGAETVTVPGALAGWAELLRKYGTITLAQAIEPAIRYAEEGFPVTPVIAADWNEQTDYLRHDPGARATFSTPRAMHPRPGNGSGTRTTRPRSGPLPGAGRACCTAARWASGWWTACTSWAAS